MIPFNKPYLTGKETDYIKEAVNLGKISGNGYFTNKCHLFFEEQFGFKKTLLTTSCTDALEMAAILLNIKEGDEVIVPSYTFVSSALAFIRQGAKIVFADSRADHPGIDEKKLENLISKRTKAIVVIHYAGVACDMDLIMDVAQKHNIFVVEDAAQAIDSYYNGKALGSIGHLGAFSFHETKNIISGEGGLLTINDNSFIERSEIIWEKGTNRSAFYKGEVDKYGWVDTGSSFLPSEIISAFLYSQLEKLPEIQKKRVHLWDLYYKNLRSLEIQGSIKLPFIPGYATNNAHMFYIIADNVMQRDSLIAFLKKKGILAVFHYLSLHKSDYYTKIQKENKDELPMADHYTDCLIRLPMFYELTEQQVLFITDTIKEFYQ
ncbi:dTDP-4-amino-4,6-dideoxygalactose transaminase [Leptobacterium flavescens]|uniref:dTDP-4-amino-4,6-dideoxygalactose transaminase n=1 Tax=Leptobacterium flavescens TaxID=472055 RepID=A0A6P0UL42_9FLAO|nr:dTDP-4-amino-4,6-dideoxygalactose transaminase [Leptobacterium flavescens]NER13252.1 dTDP-4-amino-4,6-dideoxygalactose transaminase [Leptobacterium flavescens]